MKRDFFQKTVLLVLILFTMAVANSWAIPAFARKYETSCQTCHIVYPKLNAFGRVFLNNGYRMSQADEELAKEIPIQLGADAWKQVWPNAVWPGDIPRWFPLSVSTDFLMTTDPNSEEGKWTEFHFPRQINLLAAARMGNIFSYFTNLTLLEHFEFGGLHRIFFQIHPFGESTLFNIKLGGYETRAVPFSGHKSLNSSNFMINSLGYTMETLENRLVELGGHHGGSAFTLGQSQVGIELWGAKGFKHGGIEWAVGVVNGNGLGGGGEGHDDGDEEHLDNEGTEDDDHGEEHGEDFPSPASGLLTHDNNMSKDIYWRFSLKLGGMSIAAKPEDEGGEVTILQDTDNWKDNSIRFGIFGYNGKNPVMENITGEKFSRIGFDVDWWLGNLNLFGGAWLAENNGPFTLEEDDHAEDNHESEAPTAEFKSYSFFVQADYVIYPWLIGSLRWEKFQANRLSVWHENGFEPVPGFLEEGITRFVPHVSVLFRANVKIVLEADLFSNEAWKKNNRYKLTLAVSM